MREPDNTSSVQVFKWTHHCVCPSVPCILSPSVRRCQLNCFCTKLWSNGTPRQYSCLENPMDGGAWYTAVHGVAEGQTRLRDFTFIFHFSLSCIGEGNGNPLQCSCLENPRDGGAWWAAVYGVAQSRTRLKRLSSSSSSIDVMKE